MTRTELLTRAKSGAPINPVWIISGVIKLVEVVGAWIGAAKERKGRIAQLEARIEALERSVELIAKLRD